MEPAGVQQTAAIVAQLIARWNRSTKDTDAEIEARTAALIIDLSVVPLDLLQLAIASGILKWHYIPRAADVVDEIRDEWNARRQMRASLKRRKQLDDEAAARRADEKARHAADPTPMTQEEADRINEVLRQSGISTRVGLDGRLFNETAPACNPASPEGPADD